MHHLAEKRRFGCQKASRNGGQKFLCLLIKTFIGLQHNDMDDHWLPRLHLTHEHRTALEHQGYAMDNIHIDSVCQLLRKSSTHVSDLHQPSAMGMSYILRTEISLFLEKGS